MRIIQSRSESRRSLALHRLNDRNVMGQLQLNDVKDFMWQADAFTMDSVADFVNIASHIATKASLNGPCFAMKAIYCKAGASTTNEGCCRRMAMLVCRSDGRIGSHFASV